MNEKRRHLANTTKPVSALTAAERAQMLALMRANYFGVDAGTFARDLAEKSQVMLLCDQEAAAVVGFSTLMVLDFKLSASPVKAVFSGDTIVARDCRRTTGLGVELGRCFLALLARFPHVPIYWILTSKGCRTYALLPLLFVDFSPRYDRPIPALHKELMDAFGRQKYPREYDPASGLIRYRGQAQRLRPGVANASERRLQDPHTRFFVQANPDHMQGDDLVCVAEVAEGNFSQVFRRLMR